MAPKTKEGGAPSKKALKRKILEDDNEDYRVKRERNNIAVRKSREKSRAKAMETQERVTNLKKENAELEMKVQLLSKELRLLKDLFLMHAKGVASKAEKCPDILADVVPNGEEEARSLEEDEDKSMYAAESTPGTPVNEEGFLNDHEYFSRRARPCVC